MLLERAQCITTVSRPASIPAFTSGHDSGSQLDRVHGALLAFNLSDETPMCTDQRSDLNAARISPAKSSGLFPGGEVTALLEFVEVHEVG